MKIYRIIIFPALILLSVISCQSEDIVPPNLLDNVYYVHPDNVFHVTVDSVYMESQHIDVSADAENGNFYIYNTEFNNGWSLVFPKDTEPGQQLTVGGPNPQAVFYHYADTISGFEYAAISGSITVISKDTVYQRIKGTFEGEMHSDGGNIHVADGYFDLKYGVF